MLDIHRSWRHEHRRLNLRCWINSTCRKWPSPQNGDSPLLLLGFRCFLAWIAYLDIGDELQYVRHPSQLTTRTSALTEGKLEWHWKCMILNVFYELKSIDCCIVSGRVGRNPFSKLLVAIDKTFSNGWMMRNGEAAGERGKGKGTMVWYLLRLNLSRIGLVKNPNRTSQACVNMFEIVRSNSCVNTEKSSHDTEKLRFLAISLYRDWISVCRDWKHCHLWSLCVPVKERKIREFGSRTHRKTPVCLYLYPVKERP